MKHTVKNFVGLLLLSVICTIGFPNQAEAEDDKAIAVVEALHEILLNNMQQAETRGFTGRYQSLSPFIEKSFDFPLIAKVILSRHWNKLNEDEQAQFIDRFTELTKTTYAARFNAYSDEAFKTLGTEQLRKGRLLVKTEIQSSADKARLNYLMHPVDNEWLIISVIANGVNDLSLKRAEYSRIISQDSFTGLLDIINAKITELRAAEDLSS